MSAPTPVAPTRGPSLRALGLLAILLYVPHVAWHVSHGAAWDLFWVCNVSMPVLAAACFLGHARLAVTTVLILCYGTPMWLLDLMTGGALVPTSILTHFGGLGAAALAVRRLGWPRGAWRFACGVALTVLAATRLLTPPGPNVNLAHRVHDGWETWFPSHAVYLALMWCGSALTFFVIERVVLHVGERARRREHAA